MKGRLKINFELTGYEDLIRDLNEKINDIILVIIACVVFSGGCRLCPTELIPLTPGRMPLIALVLLMIGVSLGIYALKRIFRKK